MGRVSWLSAGLGFALTTALVAGQVPQGPQEVEPTPIKRAVAPSPGPYAPGFDALHYDVVLELPLAGASIRGRTTVTVGIRAPRMTTLALDLTGLIVDGVQIKGAPVSFEYRDGKIHVPMPSAVKVGDTIDIEVAYHGQPDDGLIIQQNVHGERTAFADNWPDRARFWFPCIDHPSDKATVAFTVSAPANWTVLSNGAEVPITGRADVFQSASSADEARILSQWRVAQPIPTYTMVVGAAPLVSGTPVRSCAAKKCVDVTWWSFPADATKMELSFRRSGSILEYFAQLIGPFEYERLAHVQSSTMFGGMENTGVIFYPEEDIAKGQNIESTVAHETAHQWFGNSVSIRDWHELWLSEGFATYFGALFYQFADGEASFRKVMEEERQVYLASDVVTRPVIDKSEQDLLALLNANNYQKGGWILHMLRSMLGEQAFLRGIRTYYRRHRHGNATTDDLRKALETSSGKQLGWFFRQWLYEPGHPKLRSSMEWNEQRREVALTIEQTQPPSWPTYRLPLTIELSGASSERRKVELSSRKQTFRFRMKQAPALVTIDPDEHVLKQIEQ